jgi:hypothetical protein
VVNAIRHGMTNGQIRRRLGVSLDAVKYHVSNAVGKLGLASRSQLKHWHGAAVDSAVKKGVVVMPVDVRSGLGLGSIGQVSRQVRDLSVAICWYRDVLGLPHLATFGTLAFFDCHGTRLFLSQGAREDGSAGDSILYFRTDDIEATHRLLTDRGVTFKGAPHMIHRHESGGKLLALMSEVSR